MKFSINLGFKRCRKGIVCLTMFFAAAFQMNEQLDASEAEFPYYPQEQWLAEYIHQMPWEYYSSYYVRDLGWFWVDQAKDCVKDTIKQGKIWEKYIIAQLAKYIKPGDSVIDIGAHMGTISIAMSNLVGKTGRVYSFEGERQFFRELWHNIYSNDKKNIFPHLCWISDHEEDVMWQPHYDSNYSPVVNTNNKQPWPLHIRTLDSFRFEKISVMKIDVECTEDAVLRGAQELIRNSRPVLLIEIMGGFGQSSDPQVHARITNTIENLNKMDYHVTKILVDDYLAIPKEKM